MNLSPLLLPVTLAQHHCACSQQPGWGQVTSEWLCHVPPHPAPTAPFWSPREAAAG